MDIFLDRQPVARLDDVLVLYHPHEFESPTRSTIPLLSLLKYESAIWKSLIRSKNAVDHEIEGHLEFTVDPVKGKGKPSQTDLMLIGNDIAVAVEAKWTEPPYSSVEEWITEGVNSNNRREVMRGWLSLLQPHAPPALHLVAFRGATYQMVHRAASACATSRSPALAYLQFSPLASGIEPDIKQVQSMLSLSRICSAPPLRFHFL